MSSVVSKKPLLKPLRLANARGIALLDVLIATGIVFLAFLPIVYLANFQAQEGRRLQIKLDTSTIKNDLIGALSEADGCRRSLIGRFTINESQIDDANYAVPLTDLRDAGNIPILAVGENIAGVSDGLRVEAIELINFEKVRPDYFRFDIKVGLSSNGAPADAMIIPRVRVMADTYSPASARTPESCAFGAPKRRECRIVRGISRFAGVRSNIPEALKCAADEDAVAGGGACLPYSFVDEPDGVIPFPNGTLGVSGAELVSADDHEMGYVFENERRVVDGLDAWWFDCLNNRWDFVYQRTVVLCCKR